MPRPDRVLAAVLFTDIVDSTSIAEQLGDRGWRALVSRHHAVVRRALKQHGGKELDTAGDGFFASFPDPGSAVRCACSVSDQLRDLGVAMRGGVHFGECEPADGKLSGINVVVGARLMSLAGPGEVLVSSTVAELTRGAGFGLDDRGTKTLKGVEQPWQVFAVSSVDDVPRLAPMPAEEASAARAGAAAQAGVASTRRRWRVTAGAAGVVVLVGVAGWFLTHRAPLVPTGDTVARLSSDGSGFDQAVAVQTGGLPQAVAADAAYVWVVDVSSQTVTQITTDGANARVIGTPAGPTDVAVVGTDAWVTYGFSPDAQRQVDVVPPDGGIQPADVVVPDGTTPISSVNGVVWLAAQRAAQVTRYDTVVGSSATVQLPDDSGPVAIAATSDLSTAWVAAGRRNEVYRVTVKSGKGAVSTVSTGSAAPTAIAVAPDGTVWVAAQDSDTVLALTKNGDSRLRLDLGSQCDAPTDLVATSDRVVVACGGSQTVISLDPTSGSIVSRADVAGVPVSVSSEPSGTVWVLVAPAS
jgi:class 3 adenylate cyclase/sugar lactone lactonase YvrE